MLTPRTEPPNDALSTDLTPSHNPVTTRRYRSAPGQGARAAPRLLRPAQPGKRVSKLVSEQARASRTARPALPTHNTVFGLTITRSSTRSSGATWAGSRWPLPTGGTSTEVILKSCPCFTPILHCMTASARISASRPNLVGAHASSLVFASVAFVVLESRRPPWLSLLRGVACRGSDPSRNPST